MASLLDSLNLSRQESRRTSRETSSSFVGLLGAARLAAAPSSQSPYLGGKGSTCDTRQVVMPGQVSNWIRQVVDCPPKARAGADAAAEQKKKGKRIRRADDDARAARLVSDFCERYPALGVEPAPEALEEFAQSCSPLPRSALARAFHEQLSWASGDMEWQPRLRALFALEYLGGQESRLSRTLVKKVVGDAEEILRHLQAEVPQCREKAKQVLNLSRLPIHSKLSL